MDLESEVVPAIKRSLQNEINEIQTKVQANTEQGLVNIVKKKFYSAIKRCICYNGD